ncbi:MAG: glycosyltransferase family 39 protein [Alphaproteobacteria bacterium]|nr:glycosyltransferase family 39 protein [Alphaproteobacteria bacterium]
MLALLCCFIFNGTLLIDEFEHLRASYLITLGFHPYADFFEHHHPLLWWLWTPILKFLPQHQVFLFYLSRLLTTMVSGISAYYIYKIAERFCGGAKVAVLTLVIYFSFYFSQYMAVIFKPDAFMWSCYLCGLYYFLCYCETYRCRDLIVSAVAFTFAFMFLQTALFLTAPLVFPAVYLICRKPALIKDFLISALPTIPLLAIFTLYIAYTSGFENYINRAWILNSALFNLIQIPFENFLPKFLIFIIFGYIAYGWQLKKHRATLYTHIFAILLTADLIKNILYPVPYPRYFMPSALGIAFLAAPAIYQASSFIRNYFVATVVVLNTLNIYVSVIVYPNTEVLRQVNNLPRPSSSWSVHSEILDIYSTYQHFHWYSYILSAVDTYLFSPEPDSINQQLIKTKPTYIFYNPEAHTTTSPRPHPNADKKFEEFYDKATINTDLLNRLYECIDASQNKIYRLKQRYDLRLTVGKSKS